MRAHLVVVSVVVASCLAPGGASSSASERFCVDYWNTLLDHLESCGQSHLQREWLTEFCAAQDRHVVRGLVAFDAAKAERCVQQLAAAACDDSTAIDACDEALQGTVAEGGACFPGSVSDCVDGVLCAAGDACPGTCTKPAAKDEPCNAAGCESGTSCIEGFCRAPLALGHACGTAGDPPCDETGFCAYDIGGSGPLSCRARRDTGGKCQNDAYCRAELVCLFTETLADGVCGAPGGEGASCLQRCAEGFSCQWRVGEQFGHCAVLHAEGEPCDVGLQDCAGAARVCDRVTSKCRGLVEEGGPCTPGRLQCAAGSCDYRRVCAAPGVEGDPCGEVDVVDGAYDPRPCASGLACRSLDGVRGTCVKPPALGETCGQGVACVASYCDRATSKCTAMKGIGVACASSEECENFTCRDGTCRGACEP